MKTRTKGGNLTKEDRELQKKLIDLGLFNRKHYIYLRIEKELQKLSDLNAPAKMFDLFLYYCSKRYQGKFTQELYADSEVAKSRQEELLIRFQLARKHSRIQKLATYSSSIFFFYATAFMEEYLSLAVPQRKRSSNMYSFEVTTSVELSTIVPYYSKKQLEKIYTYLLQEHRAVDLEFNTIFEQSTDKESLKNMHKLFITQVKKVEIDDVINILASPFYLTEKEREPLMAMLQRERYRPLEYKFVEKTMNYKPSVSLMVNLDKPTEYIKEMLFAIKPEWERYNEYLNISNNSQESQMLFELRKNIMATNQHKTLAGKLTDILYVYDQKVFGFTNTRIQGELGRYWKHCHPRLSKKGTQSSSTSTIHQYFSYAKKIIDEQYFKKY